MSEKVKAICKDGFDIYVTPAPDRIEIQFPDTGGSATFKRVAEGEGFMLDITNKAGETIKIPIFDLWLRKEEKSK